MDKKRTKSTLWEYFDESVIGNMKYCVTSNEPFKVSENGKTYYYAILLDADKIGGINKKSKNDQEIGGMIECVKGGRVDVLVTSELNERGEILFLPTMVTIDCLQDYGKFVRCDEYEFVKLNSSLEIVERTGIFVSYDICREIANGHIKLEDYLASQQQSVISEETSDDDDEDDDDDDDGGTVFEYLTDDNLSGMSDSESDEEPEDSSDDAPNSSVASKFKSVMEKAGQTVQNVVDKIADETGYKDMVPDAATKPAQPIVTAAPQVASQTVTNTEPEPEKNVEYTEVQIETSIARIFHADNLELSVSSDPFDQLFTINGQLFVLNDDARDEYVNKHLNNMMYVANENLKKFRKGNIAKLREKYFMLMSLRILDIQKELDVNNQATEYGSQKWAIDETKKDKLSRATALAEEKRKVIEEEYARRRDEYCNEAAQRARNEFNNKYQRAHNDEMDRVEGIVKHNIQVDYESEMQALYAARRTEALTLLDLNITGVLKELTLDYHKMVEEENAMFSKYLDELREYAEKLHSDDAKLIAVNEENIRMNNEIISVRAEAEAKVKQVQQDYDTSKNMLETKLQLTEARAESQSQMLKAQLVEQETKFEKEKTKLQEQLDNAIERAASMQEAVRVDYEHRLEQANDDRDSWKQTFESYKEQHRHNNRLATIVVIAATIAALAGGFMAGGMYWNKLTGNEPAESSNSKIVIDVPPTDYITPIAPGGDAASGTGQISSVVNIS